MFIIKSKSSPGFTLIEIMVAVSIFAIVAVIAVGALLTANAINQKAQATKIVMDNLNFALDSMIFKMRRSGAYYCTDATTALPPPPYDREEGRACTGGESAIVLKDKDKYGHQYIYFFDTTTDRGALKFVDTDRCELSCDEADAVVLTAATIDINELKFYVSEDSPRRAIVSLFGEARVGKGVTQFALETAASERR